MGSRSWYWKSVTHSLLEETPPCGWRSHGARLTVPREPKGVWTGSGDGGRVISAAMPHNNEGKSSEFVAAVTQVVLGESDTAWFEECRRAPASSGTITPA